MTFNRLVRIGWRCRRHVLARPGRAIQLALQSLDEVPFHQNDRRKLVVGVHLELHVVAPRETVMTAVRAPSVRIQCPVERHALDGVEGGPARDFLITRLVGAALGLRQRERSRPA